MGYSTDFKGVLKFKNEFTASKLAEISKYLGKDRRDLGYKDDSIYENGKYGDYWYHIDLELIEDFSGLQWNGSEKTYDLENIINWLMDKCDFELEGELLAQGEDCDDRYILRIVDGRAIRIDQPRIGQRITCPHCDEEFVLEE